MFSEGNGYVIYWDTIQHVIKQNVDRLKLVIAQVTIMKTSKLM